MKSRHVDTEVRPFFKLFEQLGRRHDYATVFDDFITISLTQFVHPDCEIGKSWHHLAISKYEAEEKSLINQMFAEMILSYKQNIVDDTSWFDFFGNLYMEVAGKSKSSRFGQFFTPEDLCDFINLSLQLEGTGKYINDPACGSGRMLISHHVKNLGNYYVGEDLDLICCKMTVLNFLFHACIGEIIHHDSLMEPDTFRHRFVVNRFLDKTGGIPHVTIEVNGELPYTRFKKLENMTQPLKEIEIAPVYEQLSLF
ncbi:MAG: restriction endonuclease subunit M [Shinella sp.]|nr:MAG: restriction endonuclease subunit M [Shinella sp.]